MNPATFEEAQQWLNDREGALKVPLGTYVKPSGAMAAYPVRRLTDEEIEERFRLLQEKCDRFASALVNPPIG